MNYSDLQQLHVHTKFKSNISEKAKNIIDRLVSVNIVLESKFHKLNDCK